jgi:hypothetical protein
VKAQAQGVQVPEGLQRDLPCRAVRGLGKDQFAQLGEHGRQQAQAGVGQQQAGGHDQQRTGIAWREVQRIDQALEQHRHADVGDLGADQEDQREAHPPAVAPQVGRQALQRGPVAARLAGRCTRQRGGIVGGVTAGGGMAHRGRMVRKETHR